MKRIFVALLIVQSSLIMSVDENKPSFFKRIANHFVGKQGLEKAENLLKNQVPTSAGDAGEEFGKRVISGASEELQNQAYKGKEWLAAGTLALLTTPLAKVVIVAGAGALALGVGSSVAAKCEQRNFRKCLNKHFTGELNDRGFPKECEIAQASYASWDFYGSEMYLVEYRQQRHLAQKITK